MSFTAAQVDHKRSPLVSCATTLSPYIGLIQRYFPPAEHERANCIQLAECCPDDAGFPTSCVRPIGAVDCGGLVVQNAVAYGIFGILDACWNPALNQGSPFTAAIWSQVMDPEVNTWMASVIWSRNGWGVWTTCGKCDACVNPGPPPTGATYPIPFPDGPATSLPPSTMQSALVPIAVIGVGAAVYALMASRKRR